MAPEFDPKPRKRARWRPGRLLGTLALGAALALSSACSASVQPTSEQKGTPVAGGNLSVALATDTSIIDPSITGSSITALITRNIVDSLVGQGEDNSFTPWLARKWEVEANNTRYVFHLRQDVTFSDGTALDAAAVKTNFDRILDPATSSSYAKLLLGPVKEITTPDAATVVVSYAQPFAPLL